MDVSHVRLHEPVSMQPAYPFIIIPTEPAGMGGHGYATFLREAPGGRFRKSWITGRVYPHLHRNPSLCRSIPVPHRSDMLGGAPILGRAVYIGVVVTAADA